MIRVGARVSQAIKCPTCEKDCRVVAGAGTVQVSVYCSNPECTDKDRFFTVDRMLGQIVKVAER